MTDTKIKDFNFFYKKTIEENPTAAFSEILDISVKKFGNYMYAKGGADCLEAEQSDSGWISVKDQLPDNDGSFLCRDNYHKMTRVLSYSVYHGCWDDEHGDDYYTDAIGGKVTHWMPLPEPPTNNVKE